MRNWSKSFCKMNKNRSTPGGEVCRKGENQFAIGGPLCQNWEKSILAIFFRKFWVGVGQSGEKSIYARGRGMPKWVKIDRH